MRRFARILLVQIFLALGVVADRGQVADGGPAAGQFPGLRNATVLIIRHAEKPATGDGLSPEGYRRARAYADFFRRFEVDSKPVRPDWLFASSDSRGSRRPRLTLEPLGAALGRPLDTRFRPKEPGELAQELKSKPHGKVILICWHHGEIPELIRALGGQPEKLLPHGEWPSGVFNWIVELRYDDEGRLIPGEAMRINEDLMPGDSPSTGADR
jgi:hypothetical protein